MLPKISAICPTFGRVEHLKHAIECFLRQQYDGERELIVLNTFNRQKFIGKFPNVLIINLDNRPKSLGEARNMAVQLATGEIVVTFDDDDLYAANHLTNFGSQFTDPKVQWVWLSRQFYAENGRILKIDSGQMPCFAFRKSLWEQAGKYQALTVGEDRNFIGRVTSSAHGVKVDVKESEISFIYCWGNGAYHTSGLGDDRAGIQPAHTRIERDLLQRVRNNKEPVGQIIINPQLKMTPEAMIERFFTRSDDTKEFPLSVCIVELGRYGDIINILPICQHIAERHGKVHLMVSREFASVLEGVSYVIPEIFEMSNEYLIPAMQQAKKKFDIVLRGQIWGNGHVQDRQTASFNRESWRELGFGNQFFDDSFKVTFDLRNPGRELALWNSLKKTDKPALLVQVTKSVSSPFPAGKTLLEAITAQCGAKYEVINLETVQAERIFDLIGLLDRSAGLVACDTALLHLADASDVPVVSIVNIQGAANGWSASQCRCDERYRLSYQAAEKSPQSVIEAILEHVPCETPEFQVYEAPKLRAATKRRIYHCVERHSEQSIPQRKLDSWRSWDSLYESGRLIPAHYWNYKRDARLIGDRRDLPYLKDVLEHALNQANDNDIIMWTNDDNWLHPELPRVVEFYAGVWGAVCGMRSDWKAEMPQRISPLELARRTEPFMGRDMFAFTKAWLARRWGEIGDVILGASIFDLYLCAFIRYHHEIITTRANLFEVLHPAEIPRGYIGHQVHISQWTKESHKSPAEAHNRRIFHAFAQEHLPNLRFTPELAI